MVVVSDTSPLNYLVLIGEAEILPQLFGRVHVPEAVVAELNSPGAPPDILNWAASPPAWLVQAVATERLEGDGLERLGAGEREAISLSVQFGPTSLLLIDEVKGRREAERCSVKYIGTLGLLEKAAVNGLLHLPNALERLLQTTFFITPALLKIMLDEDAKRRGIGAR
jgi:predicted nucleic acid-binding protein